jgi:hypothetical protein
MGGLSEARVLSVGEISEGWAVAWAAYSVGTAIPTALAMVGLHSAHSDQLIRLVIVATWVIFVGLAWAMLVTILVDNCGGGGDCDPYKGVHGWSSGKAALTAGLPIVAAAVIAEIFVRVRNRGLPGPAARPD